MLLTAKMLHNVAGVNSFSPTDALRFTEGDNTPLTFILMDATLDDGGRRYVPPAGTTLQVTLFNVDDDIQIIRAASQPFSGDLSMWRLALLTTDIIRGTVTMGLRLTEPDGAGSKVIYGRLENALRVDSSEV